MDYQKKIDNHGQPYLQVALTDYALLANPLLNKGMAFTQGEREEFGLLGLLPPHEATFQEQLQRSYEAFKNKTSELEQYIYLRDLQDSNETLFYGLVCEHITETLPIVYTPTVGLGCQRFSHVYRRPRGVFISYPDRYRIDKILSNPRFDSVNVIVVSDGERILGLGDQGAGGMGIPIGKLALYSACAGIHPSNTLPILLDAGCNNHDLRQDPLYIGWQHERIRGADYDEFIDLFVQAVKKRFPHVLLHWEDFAQQNATPLLERYRDELCTFNDDIQGTAAVVLGTLLAAIDVTGKRLIDQRIVVLGAGSAGCGISHLLCQAMIDQGLDANEAQNRFYLVDRDGLLTEGTQHLLPFQQPFVQRLSHIANWTGDVSQSRTLLDVINNAKPTVLIGVCGIAGAFNESVVRAMSAGVERPIIFPLSNPTSRSEGAPQDLLTWSQGRAIIGTGSPFPNITHNGVSVRVDQTNNAYIFPGLGLGLVAVKATRCSEQMFIAAGETLSNCSPAKHDPHANLLPPLTSIREVCYQVAVSVAQVAVESGLAVPHTLEQIHEKIRQKVWQIGYLPYKKA